MFNGHRYSQAAAYNQSVIQRHSAGSFLIGATWYQSSFDYSDIRNFIFMIIGHGIHRIKVRQANLGLGYGYNWVPFRGLVVNAMAMPTISLYNRVKAYKYETNYDLSAKESVDNYGDWNKETRTWSNGKASFAIIIVVCDVLSFESFFCVFQIERMSAMAATIKLPMLVKSMSSLLSLELVFSPKHGRLVDFLYDRNRRQFFRFKV